MAFSCGIIGLPNSGKSTIFNALTRLSVPSQPYPFCTIEPNVGIVAVPDVRLAKLSALLKPEKATHTTIEFVDIAGLIKDAHKGEGLGNKFLSHIRNIDAIGHVVRCFRSGTVPHVYADVDPARDAEIVETEILISDLDIVEERLQKLERLAKLSKEKSELERDLLTKIKRTIEKGSFVKSNDYSSEEQEVIRSFGLIASKPLFYIANIDEDDVNALPADLVEPFARGKGRSLVYICGKLEEDLSRLEEEERLSYMEMYSLKDLSFEKIIEVGYGILDLITFYTVVGKEMRAWTVPANTPCARVAGKIHTDMERGFIKAEVLAFEDFMRCGSEYVAREKGLLRIEGRDYLVKDGDILHIRFNV